MNLQQIVVPNELLETSEFKSFISSLNSFPVEGPAFASSLFPPGGGGGGAASEASGSAKKASGQSGAGGQQAPPNTPNTTRPPSTTAEISTIKSSPPPSPQPCSSREVSRGGFDDPPAILPTSTPGRQFSAVVKFHLGAFLNMSEQHFAT